MAHDFARARVLGRVQGVGFRWYTRAKAQELGLDGWCANLDDGSVEVWLEGESAQIDAMVAWLQRGPPSARVERVMVERGAQAAATAPSGARVAF